MQKKQKSQSRLFRIGVLSVLVSALRLSPLPAGIITYLDTTSAEINDSGSVAFASEIADRQGSTGALFLNLADGTTIPVALRDADFPVADHVFVRLFGSVLALNNRNDVLFAAEMRNEGGDSRSAAIVLYLHDERRLVRVLHPIDLRPESDPLVRVGLNQSRQAAFTVTVGGEDRLYSYDAGTRRLTILAKDGDAAPGGGAYIGFDHLLINEKGTVLFRARVAEPESTALFLKPVSQPIRVVYRSGQPLPTQPEAAGELARVGDLLLNEMDTVVFSATLNHPDSMGGLFAVRSGEQVKALALDQQKVDDVTLNMRQRGGVFSYFYYFLSPNTFLNDSDQVMFETGPHGQTFFTSVPNPEVFPVCVGCTAPVGADTLLVSSLGGFNNLAQAVFEGRKTMSHAPSAIFLREGFGEFRRVFDISQTVPGVRDLSFQAVYPAGQLTESGDVLIVADLVEPPRQGLFVISGSSELRKVAITGDLAPGSQALRRLVFSQFADGPTADGTIRTSFLLINPRPFADSATVFFRKSDGSPARVTVAGHTDDHFTFPIDPKGTLKIETERGQESSVGYVIIEAGADLAGIEIFSVFDPSGERRTEAGVLPSAAEKQFTVGVEAREDVNTGLALVNLTEEPAGVTFTARNEDGEVAATAERVLHPGEHLALNVAGEIFRELERLIGSIDVTSSVELYRVTLRNTPTTLTTLPNAR